MPRRDIKLPEGINTEKVNNNGYSEGKKKEQLISQKEEHEKSMKIFNAVEIQVKNSRIRGCYTEQDRRQYFFNRLDDKDKGLYNNIYIGLHKGKKMVFSADTEKQVNPSYSANISPHMMKPDTPQTNTNPDKGDSNASPSELKLYVENAKELADEALAFLNKEYECGEYWKSSRKELEKCTARQLYDRIFKSLKNIDKISININEIIDAAVKEYIENEPSYNTYYTGTNDINEKEVKYRYKLFAREHCIQQTDTLQRLRCAYKDFQDARNEGNEGKKVELRKRIQNINNEIPQDSLELKRCARVLYDMVFPQEQKPQPEEPEPKGKEKQRPQRRSWMFT
jgi:hypothetical protein